MRERESSLQQCGEFLLKAQLVWETVAPHFVRGVRRFLARPTMNEPVADQVRGNRQRPQANGLASAAGQYGG